MINVNDRRKPEEGRKGGKREVERRKEVIDKRAC